MKTQEESPLRFKTEAEFVKEFGEDWRHTGDKRWNKAMDYLFGLPCNPEWIGKLESIHPEKCQQRGHIWSIGEWMVTTDPLPQEQTEAVSQEAPVNKWAFLYACYKGDTEVVAKYIEQGGDVNVRGSLGYVTGLHEAAQGNRVAVAKMLIAAGADVTTQNGDGKPALDIAQAYNHKVIVDLILAAQMKKAHPHLAVEFVTLEQWNKSVDEATLRARYTFDTAKAIEGQNDFVNAVPDKMQYFGRALNAEEVKALYEGKEVESDPVNRPAHYNQGGIECIEAIRAALTEEEFRGYLKGNALKYIWREGHKGNSQQDVKKAIWYLSKLID
jgi:hypothetical protein